MKRSMAIWGPTLVFIAAALWATDAPFRLHLTQGLTSNFIVFMEHAISCIVAIPVLFLNWKNMRALNFKQWLAVVSVGVFGSALAAVFFTESFHYVNPSVAIVLQKIQPIVAIALAWAILGERPGKSFVLWTLLALFGAYLVSFPNFVPQTYQGEVFNPNVVGASLALLAAILWGAETVFGKYVLSTASFQTLTSLRFVIGLITLALLNAIQGTFPSPGTVTGTDVLFLFIVAFTSGVFSLYLYYYGLQFTRASVATIAELGFPLAAVFVNAYFIPGNWAPGTYLGLFTGQWVGTLLLLFAMLMLSRVNRAAVAESGSIASEGVAA